MQAGGATVTSDAPHEMLKGAFCDQLTGLLVPFDGPSVIGCSPTGTSFTIRVMVVGAVSPIG
jgi:hypothetical protein